MIQVAQPPLRVPLAEIQRAGRRRVRVILFASLVAVGIVGTVEAFAGGPGHSPWVAVATILAIPALIVVWLGYLFYQRHQRRLWRALESSERQGNG